MLNEARTFLHEPQDYQDFRDSALHQAEIICEHRGVRLTKLRKRVLEILWQRNIPIGAYDILDVLKKERAGAAPPTVYRVLEFLVENGLVHRIERLNAYLGCRRPAERHTAQFLLCRGCGAVAEMSDKGIDEAIDDAARGMGFELSNSTIELEGLCPRCRSRGAE